MSLATSTLTPTFFTHAQSHPPHPSGEGSTKKGKRKRLSESFFSLTEKKREKGVKSTFDTED